MIVSLVAVILASAAPATTEPELISGPIKMSAKEIRAYNAMLPSDHPNYIRCARVEETGSLVKKKSVCRTNQEWARLDTAGNREAREVVENLQKGWTSGR